MPNTAEASAPPKPLRRRQSDPRPATVAKRRRIRELGAVLFAERGLFGMSLRALGRAARIPTSSMIYYYGKREELLADIVAEHLIGLHGAVCAAFDVAAAAAPSVRLEAMLLAFLDGVHADRHAHTLAVHASCAMPTCEREAARLRLRLVFETLAEPLLAVSPSFAAQPERAALLAMAVAASAGDALLAFDGAEQIDRPEFARGLAAMLLAGARPEGDVDGRCLRPSQECARAWLLHGDAVE